MIMIMQQFDEAETELSLFVPMITRNNPEEILPDNLRETVDGALAQSALSASKQASKQASRLR